MAHLTQNPADKERFICLYPVYINSKKTLAEGRRIPAEKVTLVAHVQFLLFHSPSGKDVMFYVAEMIPKLKTRTQKSGGGDTSSQQGEGGKKSKKKKK
ncbi:signal recognition particle 19 kDa protein [Seriola lalandi dorsalis]|uniref:signal recognition particle 19 kDa protein n=1 Tax=Seriola lalandi dorsalis TaxID=1841481 RepID=UPI000C6FA8F3|nr:signal recognition particle 19 kDa protein [Seriola lalandi dorsalis]